MSAYKLLDFKDIYEAIAAELKLQLSDTTSLNRIKRVVNMVYLDEVSPRARWFWLQGHSVIRHKITYSSGTCSVLPNTTTVTLTVPPAVTSGDNGSFKGWYFSIDGQNETYRISSHAAEAATFILDAPYNGNSASGVAFKIYQENVPLPTDCRETVEVYYDHQATPLVGRGLQEFRKIQTSAPKTIGRPAYYCTYDFQDPTDETAETEADRYRILKVWPAISQYTTILKVDYIKDVDALDLDGDEPLMPVEDRIVLYYGALSILWSSIGRNPEESARNKALYEDKLARMMGKVTDSMDKPRVEPESTYITAKRGPRIGVYSRKGLGPGASGGSTYNSPTYLENVTINGATITANVGVNPGITVDGRDVSADGNTLDSHIASIGDVHGAIGGLVGLDNVQVITNKTIDAADNTISNISDANISASAAIAVGKLAALTASKAAVTDASGILTASTVTSAEVGHLSGVTSSIQPQLESIANHIADTTDAHNASAISVTPVGNLAAVEVQEALEELQADIDTRAPAATAVTLTGTQALTNKDYDGGTASDTSRITLPKASKATLDALTRKEGTVVYASDEDKVYYDDGAVLKAVGSGSGSSINFITNPDGSLGLANWTEGSYAAAARPSGSFTASSGASAFAISTTTTTPLGTGTTSFLLTKSSGASRQGRAVETSFTLPLSYRAKVLKIEADYIVNSGTFVAGSNTTDSSLIWYCAFSTDGGTTYTVAEPSSFKLLSNSTAISDKFSASIQTPSDATNMKLIAYVAESANSAWVVETIVSVSPSQYAFGTPITDWVSYTPTGNWSTGTATYTGRWRKVGDSIEVQAVVSLSGAPTAADFTVNIPAGLTIDVSKIPSASASMVLGSAEILDSGVRIYAGTVVYAGTTSVYVNHTEAGNSGLVNATNPTTFGAADTVSLNFKVPILGWSSSVQVSDGYDGRVVALNTSGTNNTSFTATPTAIQYIAQTNQNTTGSYNQATGVYTFNVAGFYNVKAAIDVNSSIAAAASIVIDIYKNNTTQLAASYAKNITAGTAALPTPAIVTKGEYFNAGDYIVVRTFSTSGSYTISNSVFTYLSIEKLAGNPVISATEEISARYVNSSGQSITNGGAIKVTGWTLDYDTHGIFNPSTGTATAPMSGRYKVGVTLLMANASFSSGTIVVGHLYKNGAAYSRFALYVVVTSGAQFAAMGGTDTVNCVAGDTFEIRIEHGEATARSMLNVAVYNHLTIEKVK